MLYRDLVSKQAERLDLRLKEEHLHSMPKNTTPSIQELGRSKEAFKFHIFLAGDST